MSFGKDTFLTGLGTLIILPVWGLARGEVKLALGGVLLGVILISIGYLLLKLEEPPKPPR